VQLVLTATTVKECSILTYGSSPPLYSLSHGLLWNGDIKYSSDNTFNLTDHLLQLLRKSSTRLLVKADAISFFLTTLSLTQLIMLLTIPVVSSLSSAAVELTFQNSSTVVTTLNPQIKAKTIPTQTTLVLHATALSLVS